MTITEAVLILAVVLAVVLAVFGMGFLRTRSLVKKAESLSKKRGEEADD